MVAIWNQQLNPWGPTGGNPMVRMSFRGREGWSFYKYPSKNPVVQQSTPPFLPNANYNVAWDSMKSYYVDQEGLPTFDMNAEGFTLGHPDVPGFTYNNSITGLTLTAQPPKFGTELPTFPIAP